MRFSAIHAKWVRSITAGVGLVTGAGAIHAQPRAVPMNTGNYCISSNAVAGSNVCNGDMIPAVGAYQYNVQLDILRSLQNIESYAKQSGAKMDSVASAMNLTRQTIEKEVSNFQVAIQNTINDKFATLPATLVQDPAMKAALEGLRKEILDGVARQTPGAAPSKRPP